MASITLLQKAWLFLYIYFFYFAGFYIPSIFVFCIIFCTHTAQTYLPVFYRLLHMICIINCFFFLYHPTHCLRRLPCLVLHCLCSEKCNSSWSIFSCACVVINKTTVELHAHIICLYQSLALSEFDMIARAFQDQRCCEDVQSEGRDVHSIWTFI